MTQVVTGEEERFADTLDHGLKLLSEELDYLKTHSLKILPGEVAFKLYDTYGFPLDLVQDTLREEGLVLDLEGFEAHMQAQREASRQSWKGGPGEVPLVYQELAEWPPTHFLGYDALEGDSDHPGPHRPSGPQCPGRGRRGGGGGHRGHSLLWRIRRPGGRHRRHLRRRLAHPGDRHPEAAQRPYHPPGEGGGRRRQGQRRGAPGGGRRAAPPHLAHHTATHLLQAVLRRHLGDHVKQSGSLVYPERLRFDFTHFQAISPEEVEGIELDLNQAVAENLPVLTDQMSMAEALESGATALFEEKYGDEVRVVAIPGLSQELCGGTHVERTGDLGLCKITSEASIAAGIRRIEAVCGLEAVELTQEQARELDQAAGLIKGSRADLVTRLEKVLERQKDLEKEVEALKGRMAAAQAGDLMDQVRQIEGVAGPGPAGGGRRPQGPAGFCGEAPAKLKSGIVVLGSAAGEKAMLIALVTKDLTKRFPAGEIIKAIAPAIGGSGGGRPDMAQAGGPDKDRHPRGPGAGL